MVEIISKRTLNTLGYRIADQVGYLIFENFPPCSALFRCGRLLILTKNNLKLPYFLKKIAVKMADTIFRGRIKQEFHF